MNQICGKIKKKRIFICLVQRDLREHFEDDWSNTDYNEADETFIRHGQLFLKPIDLTRFHNDKS